MFLVVVEPTLTPLLLNSANREYHRFNPGQGLDKIQLFDCGQAHTVEETTNIWLKSHAGQRSVNPAVHRLKVRLMLYLADDVIPLKGSADPFSYCTCSP